MMKRNVNKFTLATLVLAFLVVVPAVAAQIEEGQSVVCRDVNGEIEWIIGIPGESRPVDQFNWGVTGDTPVVLNGQAGVVREVKEGGLKGNLQWIIKKSDGSTERFYWGLKGDTPVVLNGQAGVVRKVGSNLQWFIKGSPAFCWGLTAKGDTPVVLNGQAGVVREVKEGGLKGNLEWFIKNPDGSTERFYWGLKGDIPVVLNGEPGVVREVGSNLKWFIKGSPAFCWGLTAKGDTPVFVPVTGAPVVPSVTAVDEIADISVAFNTTFDKIGLPARVNVTLSNSEVEEVGIDWTAAEGVYSATEVGTQTLEGNLTIPIGITNPGNLTARVNVTVGEAPFIVANVTAVNATHINVTFAEGTGIKEADLEEKVINLSAAAATLNATYVAGSLDGLTTAFALDEGLTLEDARTYDLSADWAAFAEVSFMARIADPTLTKIVKVTTGVPAVPAGQRTVIEFKALDQYGDPIAVNATTMAKTTATVAVGTVELRPLMDSEYTYTVGYNNVTLRPDLPLNEGYNLNVTIKKDGTVLDTDLEYTVGAKETRVAAALELTADKTSMPAQDTANFTVRVTDQFNTTMKVGADDIRWMVDRNKASISGYPINGSDTLNLTPDGAGTYEVTAAYGDNLNLQQTLTLIVGAAELTSINVTFNGSTNVTGTNLEPFVSDRVTANKGAAFNEGDLKFNVTAWPEGATSDDIWLKAGPEGATLDDGIYVTVKTYVAGNYTFIAYVGENYANAVSALAVTVNTTLNTTVTSIELEEIGENEVTVGSTITKNLTFRNMHGEELLVPEGKVEVSTSNARINVGNVTDGVNNVIALNIAGVAEGKAEIRIVESEGANLPVSFTVKPAGTITYATLGDLVSEHNEWAKEDAVAYMPVEFIDQYGNTMSLEATTGTDMVKVYNTTGDVTGNFAVDWAKADATKEGYGQYTSASGTDVIAAIQLNSTVADPGDYTLKIVKGGETLAEKAFVLNPARELTSITLSPASASVTRGAQTSDITVCGYDQYDALVNISGMTVSVNSDPSTVNVTMGDIAADGSNLTFTLQANASCTATISVDSGTATANTDFALTVGNVIDRIKIQGQAANVTPSGNESYRADLTGDKPAWVILGASDNTIALDVIAYGADGNEVGYDWSDLIWEITGNQSECIVTVEKNGNPGIVTIDASSSAGNLGPFTVEVTAPTGGDAVVSDTLSISISAEDPTATSDYYVAEDWAGKTRLDSISLDITENESVYIWATDQYGRLTFVPANDGSLTYKDSSKILVFDSTGDALNFSATEVTGTELRLFEGSDKVCGVPVTVTGSTVLSTVLVGLTGAEGDYDPEVEANVTVTEPTAEPTVEPTVEPTEEP